MVEDFSKYSTADLMTLRLGRAYHKLEQADKLALIEEIVRRVKGDTDATS